MLTHPSIHDVSSTKQLDGIIAYLQIVSISRTGEDAALGTIPPLISIIRDRVFDEAIHR